MLKKIKDKIFGTSDEREIKKMRKLVNKINEIEPLFEKMIDEQLQHKTVKFKERLEKETLDDILVEAFATVREASKRIVGLRYYDVQLIGGMILHKGCISEMKTEEKKTQIGRAHV